MFGKLFDKLKTGLTKTRDNLTDKINEALNLAVTIDDDMYEELEEALIMSDIGMDTTVEIIDRLKAKIRKEKINDVEMVKPALKEVIAEMMLEGDYEEEEDDKEKKLVNNIHNPQNLLMHKKQFDSIIDNVVPILTKVICEGIEKGIFNTDYPLETVEMILIYTQTVFDSNNNLSMEETLRKISAFIVNLERLLGAEKGSFDFIKQVFN